MEGLDDGGPKAPHGALVGAQEQVQLTLSLVTSRAQGTTVWPGQVLGTRASSQTGGRRPLGWRFHWVPTLSLQAPLKLPLTGKLTTPTRSAPQTRTEWF